MATKLFAVCGSPIAHSLSPQIFEHYFCQKGISAHYIRIHGDSAESCLKYLQELHLSGMNLTSPLKEGMYQLLPDCDEAANALKAVNCLSMLSGEPQCFNTDVFGVKDSLEPYKQRLSKAKVLILGSGAAAKAAAYALRDFQAQIIVAARNTQKSQTSMGSLVFRVINLEQIPSYLEDISLIINTIAHKADPQVFADLPKDTLVLDAIYHSSHSFKDICRAEYIDGLQWLWNQAAPSFKHFCGTDAPESRIELTLPKSTYPIYLIGFMGSGKSSLGKRLAKELNLKFYDMDSILTQSMNMSIEEIFQKSGEAAFRAMESDLLKELSRHKNAIISTGGGVVEAEHNRFILRSGYSIWLYRNISHLNDVSRHNRPLLSINSDAEIKALFHKRLALYASACRFMIENENSNTCLKGILDEIN